MKVLDKLRIPSEIEDDYTPEFAEDFDRDSDDVFPSPISDDDPRRDPSPGETPARKPRGRSAPAAPPRITKKHRDEAQEEIETLLNALALAWSMQAPPCGDALEAAAPNIAAKITRLVARNPKWLMKVRDGGVVADAIGIAIALKPVIQVAWMHYSQPQGGDGPHGREFDPSQFPPYDGSGIAR